MKLNFHEVTKLHIVVSLVMQRVEGMACINGVIKERAAEKR